MCIFFLLVFWWVRLGAQVFKQQRTQLTQAGAIPVTLASVSIIQQVIWTLVWPLSVLALLPPLLTITSNTIISGLHPSACTLLCSCNKLSHKDVGSLTKILSNIVDWMTNNFTDIDCGLRSFLILKFIQ